MPSVIIVKRPVEIEIDGGTVIADYGYTLDFEVSFEFDSARLTGDAKRTSAALGQALEVDRSDRLRLPDCRPHRRQGLGAYNRALSYDRAGAVRDWLIANSHHSAAPACDRLGREPPQDAAPSACRREPPGRGHPDHAAGRRCSILPRGPRNQPTPFGSPRPPAPHAGFEYQPRSRSAASDEGGLPPCPTGLAR